MAHERSYDLSTLPIEKDYSCFSPEYTPEVFTEEEKRYLKPFFSNLDSPVFVTFNLPEEVNAALDSRYSRSKMSKRRLFLEEYVKPIIHPENEEGWKNMSLNEQVVAFRQKGKFNEFIDYMSKEGGFTDILNAQRARGFFEKWLSGYNDDSIAEMGGGIHVSCEGISSVLLEEIVSKRRGISPLVKSTRYVQFSEKRPDGNYQYVVPGEIRGTGDEIIFRHAMDSLFDVYAKLQGPYLEYIKNILPKDEDETEGSFNRSRAAKRFDDLRDLLPFATQNNIGLSGNGRAYEDIINRLLANNLGEVKWLGQAICRELEKVVPSFVVRPKNIRGGEIQLYRRNLKELKEGIADDVLNGEKTERPKGKWAKLISSTPHPDVQILALYLSDSVKNMSYEDCQKIVYNMGYKKRSELLNKIFEERKFGREFFERDKDRFKKVPRAFEAAHFTLDVWGRGGDERDLHRHRELTEVHNPYTVSMGIDLEKEVEESPFIGEIREVLSDAGETFNYLNSKYGSEIAQYSVPFAYIQHWVVNLSARELYWIGELRTGPQARPHYKEIVLDMVDAVAGKAPSVFRGIMVDRNDYRLARRESEKKGSKK